VVWEYSFPWQTKLVCDQTGIISVNTKQSSPSVNTIQRVHLTPANLHQVGTSRAWVQSKDGWLHAGLGRCSASPDCHLQAHEARRASLANDTAKFGLDSCKL